MCGISGFVFLKGVERSEEMMNQIKYVFNELMVETQDRGEHATGIASFKRDGSHEHYKAPENADRMTTNDEKYLAIVNALDGVDSSVIIGHTRYKTKGDQKNNNNNHPFDVGNIIGIHNGSVQNDDTLFKTFGFNRVGEVDSEIVFQLINHYNHDEITMDGLKNALITSRIRGVFALAFMHKDNPTTLNLIKQDRPMDLAFWKEAGIVIFNSDDTYIKKAFRKLARVRNLLGITTKPTVEYHSVTRDRYFTVDANATTFAEALSAENRFYIETTYTTTYSNNKWNKYYERSNSTLPLTSNTTPSSSSSSSRTSIETIDALSGLKLIGEIDDITGEVTILTKEEVEERESFDMTYPVEDDGSEMFDDAGRLVEPVELCADCGGLLEEGEVEAGFNSSNPQGEKYCSTCYVSANAY